MSESHGKRPECFMGTTSSLNELNARLAREDLDRLAARMSEVLKWWDDHGAQTLEGERAAALSMAEELLRGQLRAVRFLRHGAYLPDDPERSPGSARPMSQVKLTENVLRDVRRPLHRREIIAELWERYGVRALPDSLSSALLKRIRAGDPIARVGPNTFQYTGATAENR